MSVAGCGLKQNHTRGRRHGGGTRRIGASALILCAGLVLAMAAQAKPTHRPMTCKTGYVRRTVWIPVRRHGRIVRRHGRIVRTKVHRCVKAKPKPKPSSPPGTPTTPTTSQPPLTTTGPSTTTTTTSTSTTTTTTTSTTPPPPPPPVNHTPPAISGSAKEFDTLTASTGSWTNSPTSYGYQWQRCSSDLTTCSPVAGATRSTYLLVSGDIGHRMQVLVQAGNAGGTASAPSAATATVTATTGDPVVVAVGDIAGPPGCSPTASGCEQSETATLAQSFHPASVLVLGDNQYESHTGNDGYSDFLGSYDLTWGQDFNLIVHPVPGNHEYLTSGAAGYFQYFGDNGVTTGAPGGYYSVNVGAWHIIALNSNCTDSGCGDALDGGTTSAQLTWLKTDLADERSANPSACVLGMWHHPLFSAGWTLGVPNVAPLYDALYNANADVVLNGHDHLYERFAQADPSDAATAGGIREFVVGTGGESLNGLSATPATLQDDEVAFGVLVLTLHSSSYSWKFVDTGGSVLDSGTTACHGAGAAAATAGTARRIAARTGAIRLDERPLVFDASPVRSSAAAVRRRGLAVAVLASRAIDVRITAWVRRRHRTTRVAVFHETESQITQPHSLIRLPFGDRLAATRGGTLILRFAAEDGAGHRRTVTRTVRLR